MSDSVAAACCCGFDGVSTDDPVAEVDDVDVLLDEDIAGEDAVPEPVAQPELVG